MKYEVTKFMLLQFDKLISEAKTGKVSSLLHSKRSRKNAYVDIDDSKIEAYVKTNYGETVWHDGEKLYKGEIKKIRKRIGDKKQINDRIELLAAVARSYWDHEHEQILKDAMRPELELKQFRHRRMFHNQLLQLYVVFEFHVRALLERDCSLKRNVLE